MNKILGMSLVVMLAFGFNLLSMDNKKQDQERKQARASLASKGKQASPGKLYSAIMEIRTQSPDKKEKKGDNAKEVASSSKRLRDDVDTLLLNDTVSVKKVKIDNNTQPLPVIVVNHNRNVALLANRFKGSFVTRSVPCNLAQEKY